MKRLRLSLLATAGMFVSPSLPAANRYVDNQDGTITDVATGLMWQKQMPSPRTQAQAAEYCNGLDLAGFGDWRLPDLAELFSIMEFNRSEPSIDPVFEARPEEFCWSSSVFAKDTNLYWTVHFGSGTDPEPVTEAHGVRAVRGSGLPANRFNDNRDGTITDLSTGLMWQKSPPAQAMTFGEAQSYCADLRLGGYSDWQLPDIRELLTINDFQRFNPAIDPIFETVWNWYWSSTPYIENPSFIWQIYFTESDVNHVQSPHAQVRAVRTARTATAFRRGDSNADGTADISDAVAILGFLFLGSTMNDCKDAADVNDDGKVDISDPVRLLGFLFLGSERPPDPFTACGVDSTGDELDCKTFDECP